MTSFGQTYSILYCGKKVAAIATFSIKAKQLFVLKTIEMEALGDTEKNTSAWLAALQPALQKLKQKHPYFQKKTGVIVTGQKALVRTLSVPTIHPKRQSLATTYETAKVLPYSISEAEWETDFIIGDTIEKISLLGAMPRKQANLLYQINC